MSLTMLAPATDLKIKPTRVKIVANTILNQGGRGVPVWKGSVLDVRYEDALMLFAGNKAVKSTEPINIVEDPHINPNKKAN